MESLALLLPFKSHSGCMRLNGLVAAPIVLVVSGGCHHRTEARCAGGVEALVFIYTPFGAHAIHGVFGAGRQLVR